MANVLHGQGDVVEISGLVGSTPAVDRHQGFVKAISAYPGIRLLAVEDGAWLQLKAGEKMDTLLSRFPHIDLVYAQNDRMAAGAYAAAAREGREKDMRFIGIDALSGKDYGVEKVLAGELDATFIYPTGGDRVMQIAMDILNKRDFPRETILGTSVVDRDNALIMKMQTAHIGTLDGKIETLNGKINQYLASYATQQVVLYGSLSALLLLVGLLVAVYLSLRAKNRLNRELSMQKKKLEEQKTQLIQQKELLEVQKSQLEQLSHELEEATHAKLVFFTNISHDFRTPLTLIADPIEQLLANRTLDGQPRQLLELMKKNVHILLRLVNQILDFRKVENGRMDLHLEPFDLLDSFRGWNDSFRMALLKKHIAFSFEASPDTDFRMMADAEKMERIYFNLFSNAVKYTPENGKITVRLLKSEQNYSLSVFNSGSYISSTDVEAIFERFYQVDGHQAGTGIGLALVRAFVEMHGGNIAAHSDDKGTTFTVTFPKQDVLQYHPTIVTLPAEEKDVSSTLIDTEVKACEEVVEADCPTVLVIDDNADIRNYVKSLLSNEFRVLDAADGTEGIRLAREFLNTYNEQTKTMIRKEIIDKYGEDRLEEILENPLDSEIHSFDPSKIKLEAGSTDVGDVGYAVPTLNINVATCCIGNVGHTWQMTAQSCSPIAHKGLLTAAKVMALASVRTMDRPDVIEAAKTEVKKRNGGKNTCPLPDSVKPPLDTY